MLLWCPPRIPSWPAPRPQERSPRVGFDLLPRRGSHARGQRRPWYWSVNPTQFSRYQTYPLLSYRPHPRWSHRRRSRYRRCLQLDSRPSPRDFHARAESSHRLLSQLYISEISPPAIRGQLVGMYEIGWQIGGLVGFWINYGITKHIAASHKQWVIPFAGSFASSLAHSRPWLILLPRHSPTHPRRTLRYRCSPPPQGVSPLVDHPWTSRGGHQEPLLPSQPRLVRPVHHRGDQHD